MLMKKLVKHGNSLALVIDKPVLEMLNINENTPLNVISDGRRLLIEPSQSASMERIEAIATRGMKRYNKMFKRLAK